LWDWVRHPDEALHALLRGGNHLLGCRLRSLTNRGQGGNGALLVRVMGTGCGTVLVPRRSLQGHSEGDRLAAYAAGVRGAGGANAEGDRTRGGALDSWIA
jgi:hypothetical protein